MVDVRLLGGLRSKVGADSLRLAADEVREVLEALIARGAADLPALLYADPRADPPEAHRDLRILVNGRSIAFLGGLDTPLQDDDKVTVHLSGARGHPGG